MMRKLFLFFSLLVGFYASAFAQVNFTDGPDVPISAALFAPETSTANWLDPVCGIIANDSPGTWRSTTYFGTTPEGVEIWFYIGDNSFQDTSNTYLGQFVFGFQNTSVMPVSMDAGSFKVVISGLKTVDGAFLNGFEVLKSANITNIDGSGNFNVGDLTFAFSEDVLTITANSPFSLTEQSTDNAVWSVSGNFTAVPEPSTWALGMVSVAFMALFMRKKSRHHGF
jgi:hypothetical protein